MRFLALDYGNKYTGLALGEDYSVLELPPIKTRSLTYLISKIKKISKQEGIDALVVGMPFNKDPKQKNLTKNLISELKKDLELTIYTVDETGTSKESFREIFTKHSALKKTKKSVHSRSAVKILERLWDSKMNAC